MIIPFDRLSYQALVNKVLCASSYGSYRNHQQHSSTPKPNQSLDPSSSKCVRRLNTFQLISGGFRFLLAVARAAIILIESLEIELVNGF